MRSYSKNQFKRELNKRIEEKNLSDLLRQIKSYKKLNHKEFSEEVYELKPYIVNLPLYQARSMMCLRAQVFKSIKFNFQSDVIFSSENWLCECQKAIQSQQHLKICEQYADLRRKHSLLEDQGLVAYFDKTFRQKESLVN